MITRILAALALAIGLAGAASPAEAGINISIDKSSQRMVVTVDGVRKYVWPVSTGKAGYRTPSGSYTPFRLEKDHFSKEWDDAPMPNSIFFTPRGHAIHGSYSRGIGRPVSHGCVRLAPRNAAILYALVQREGLGNTRITISGGGVFGDLEGQGGGIKLPKVPKNVKLTPTLEGFFSR